MANRVSRSLFYRCVGIPEERKALAFALFIKNARPASVIKGWNYRVLANISGLTEGTCKRRVRTLLDMDLVSIKEKGGTPYIYFKPLRTRALINRLTGKHLPVGKFDIRLPRLNDLSVKQIERDLMSMLIVEVQRRKDFVGQRVDSMVNPTDIRQYRKGKRYCDRRGYKGFYDAGFSYKGIAGRLHCGLNTVADIIKNGERRGLFSVLRSRPVRQYCGCQNGQFAAEVSVGIYDYYHNQYLYYQPANRFVINYP